jgi:CBS domain-containing protein
MAAKDIMTAKVVACGPDDTVEAAIALMVKRKVSGLPVVDADKVVVGIVTEADVLTARASATVASVMTAPAVTVPPSASVKTVTDLLVSKKIKRVAVVGKGGVLLGVVSRADLLKAKVK